MPSLRGKKRKLRDVDNKANSYTSDGKSGKALSSFQSTVKSVSDGENCNIAKHTDESQKFEVEGTDPPFVKDAQHELPQIQPLSLDINELTDGQSILEDNLTTVKVSDIKTGFTVKYESHASLSSACTCITHKPVINKILLCDNLQYTDQEARRPETALFRETETIVELCELQRNVSKSNEKYCQKNSQEDKYQPSTLQEMRKDEVITVNENKLENIKKGQMDTALTKGSKTVEEETSESKSSPDPLQDKQGIRSTIQDELNKSETASKYESVSIPLPTELRSPPDPLQDKYMYSHNKSTTCKEQNKAVTSFVSASQTSLLLSSKVLPDLDFPVSKGQIKKKFRPPLNGSLTLHEGNNEVTDLFLPSQSLPPNDLLSVECNDAKMQNLAYSEPAPDFQSVPKTGGNAWDKMSPVPINKNLNTFNKTELENPVQDIKGRKVDGKEQARSLKSPESKLQCKASVEMFKDTKNVDTDEVITLNSAKEQSYGNKMSDEDVVKEIDQCQREQSSTSSVPDDTKNNHNLENSIGHPEVNLNETGLATFVNSTNTSQILHKKNTTEEDTKADTNDGTCTIFETDTYFGDASQLKETKCHEDENDRQFTKETKETDPDAIADIKSADLNQSLYVACNESKKEVRNQNSFTSCSQEFTSGLDTLKTRPDDVANGTNIKTSSSEKEGILQGTEIYCVNAGTLGFDMRRSVNEVNHNMMSKDEETKITLSTDGFAKKLKEEEKEINSSVNGHAPDANDITMIYSDAHSNIRVQDSPDGTQPFCLVTFSPQLNTTLSSQEFSQDNATNLLNVPVAPYSSVLEPCSNSSGFEWQDTKKYSKELSNSNTSLISKDHNDDYNDIDTCLSHEAKTAQQKSHGHNRTSAIQDNCDGLAETSKAPECMKTLPANKIQSTPAEGEPVKSNKMMSSGEIERCDNKSDILMHNKDILNDIPQDEKCHNASKYVSSYSGLSREAGAIYSKPEQLTSYNFSSNLNSFPEEKIILMEEMSKKSDVVVQRESTCLNTAKNCPVLENTNFSSEGNLKQPDFTGGNSLSDTRQLSIAKLNQDSNVTKFIPLQECKDSHNTNNFVQTETNENETSCNSLQAGVAATDQIMITEDFQDTSCVLDNQYFLDTCMNVSDSQLCKLTHEDVFENDIDSGQMNESGNVEDEFQCGVAAAETKTLKELQKKKSEGKELVHTIMADLVSINKQLLRMKREMDVVRRKFTQQQNTRFPSKSKIGFNFGSGM